MNTGAAKHTEKHTEKHPQTNGFYSKTVLTAKYLLLTAALSFLGWAYEMLLVRFRSGHWYDRGFMSLPFCPIYGCTLLVTYFLLGTPKESRGILRNVRTPVLHTAIYLLLAFLIPTAAELLVGLIFDKAFDTWLWSYASMPLNFHGYISLSVSLLWSVMIWFFMRFFFKPLKRLIFKTPDRFAVTLATALFVVATVDITMQFLKI